MQIRKTFHFHSAHRNEKLKDKCFSLHGHTYHVTCIFNVERDIASPDISTLFADFDQVERWVKHSWDHALLICKDDPLLPSLVNHDLETKLNQKRFIFFRPTSVENLCYELFKQVIAMGYKLAELQVQETPSSTVIYTKADFDADIVEFNEVKKECYCTIDPSTRVCIVCGRSEWDWKLAKRRLKNEERAESGRTEN